MSQHIRPKSAGGVAELGLPSGAHLVTKRVGYAHHGIYIGNGDVVHYAGLSGKLRGGPVEIVSIEQFAAGFGVEVVSHPSAAYAGPDVVDRATSRLGERDYRLLSNNCEHFCLWCVFGQSRSEQVDACIRNPARALAVLFLMIACRLAHGWRAAADGLAAEARVAAAHA